MNLLLTPYFGCILLLLLLLVGPPTGGLSAEPEKTSPQSEKTSPQREKTSPQREKATNKKKSKSTKLIDWTDGAPANIITPAGAATVPTRIATFRITTPGGETQDIQIVAFKHDATNITWVGPKFTKYALVNESFFGFDAADGFGRISMGFTDRLPIKVDAGMSILTVCALYDEQDMPDSVSEFYQTVDIRKLFGTIFLAGDDTSAIGGSPAPLLDAVTNGEELKLKIQGFTPTETAEIFFGGPGARIGILRATLKGKPIPVAYAVSDAE